MRYVFVLLLYVTGVHAECTSLGGLVRAVMPQTFTNYGGILTYFCDLEPSCDDGYTHFTVGAYEYRIQHPNVHIVNLHLPNCRFFIQYDSDPIFHNEFD